jgi:ubiquinone/menaquinone biosynthesis C-methylase UbiE
MTESDENYVRFLERTSTRAGERHPALDLLELFAGRRCLHVGCGLGEDARMMVAAFEADVVGIDQNARMVEEARSRSKGQSRVSF